MNHLLTTEDLDRDQLTMLLDTADGMVSLLERDIAKAPTLRGKTVATMFFEPSTRTKLSFDKAAKALSADVMSFTASSSSLTKGESLKDTVLTVQALGVDLMVVWKTAVEDLRALAPAIREILADSDGLSSS